MKSSTVDSYSSAGFQERAFGSATGNDPRLVSHASDPRRQPTSSHPGAPPAKRRVTLAPAEGWLPLLLLLVAVYSVVFSIIYANWVDHTFILLWSAPGGLLTGLLVAKSRRVPQVMLHVAACLVGYWLSVWLTTAVALHISWLALIDGLRLLVTGGVTTTTGASSEMVFLFYLAFLCFFLGYLGSWLAYRAHLPWLVALAYCSIMLVNLNYTRQDHFFLIVVLLGALILLIARIQLATQLEQWRSEGLYTDRPWLRAISSRCMNIASILTALILIASWLFPVFTQAQWGVHFWNDLDNAMANIAHRHVSLQNIGSLVKPYDNPTNFFGDQLTVSGSVELPTGEVLNYQGRVVPQYLEGFTYDHFDGHTWNSAIAQSSPKNYSPGSQIPPDAQNVTSDQTFLTIQVVQPPGGTKSYLFAPAQPVSFSVPTTVYGSAWASAWTQQSALTRGERYTVTSNVPQITTDVAASIGLPDGGPNAWQHEPNYALLENYYLQVPGGLPPALLQTAQAWTHGAQNAYQAMQMLEAHLSDPTHFTYSVSNSPIPANVDVVSWLLQTRKGYCTYYATAMTVMARLLGVPARLVSGFSQGHYDRHRQAWIVNGDDAHSWVQIYFPGHGWISFDPTPGFALSNSRNPTVGTSPSPTTRVTPTVHTQPTPHITPTSRTHPASSGNTGTGSGDLGSPGHQELLLQFSLVTLLCSLLLFCIAAWTYWWRSLYKNTTFISGMYWRLCRIASWAGFAPQKWQTPYEYGGDLSRAVPQAAAPLQRLTNLFVHDRWAPPYQAPYAAEEADLERLWPHLRRAFLSLFWRKLKRT
ncbi:MAG: transglutaminase domain-containing protein [Ktedonobacteraceae bacterium]|nr:transglutaminase domain-containing protein [Ktedonobacteraceae bacterium]